jgi:transcriptional regulator with XRE-family HTH domain
MKKEKKLSKEIRLLGYSKQQIAEKINVTRQTVSAWCNGKSRISPVFVKELYKIGISKEAVSNPDDEA